MWTQEQEQAKLLLATQEPDWYFDFRFPVWRCPDCQTLNRYADTWGETCSECRADRTTDWEEYIVNPDVRAEVTGT